MVESMTLRTSPLTAGRLARTAADVMAATRVRHFTLDEAGGDAFEVPDMVIAPKAEEAPAG